MTDKILFSGSTHTVAGAEGYARSADGNFEIELPEPHPAAENLFAAAWSACFLGAVKFVAGKQGVKISDDAKVSAAVGIGPIPTGFALKVDLSISLPGVERAVAEKLVADAHIVCPYSNATRNNVEVSLTVV